jgi:hypothetical protein
LPEALAYFITWTTYGAWLPGDERGWVKPGEGIQEPDPEREAFARALLTEEVFTLAPEQRRLVETTVADHCRIRGWELHVVNCRTNHVDVVVTADRDPEDVRDQFKAWCTRKLKEQQRARAAPGEPIRTKWWTEGGSGRYINDEESLEAAIRYVAEGQ